MTKKPAAGQPNDLFIDLRRQAAAGGPAPDMARDALFQTIGRPRARKRILIDLNVFSVDGAYAFLLFSAALFVQQAGTLAGAAMAGLPILYMGLRHRQAGEVLVTRGVLFLAPAFAMASVIWSEAPGVSAKYGAEMWLTAAAGVGLSAAQRPTAVIKGACAAFAFYILVSIGLGRSIGVGGMEGGSAFVGLGDGKNLLADIASTGALLSLTTLFIGLRQYKATWAAFGLLATAFEVYVMLKARSAGATLALSGGVVALTGLACLSGLPRALRIGAIGVMLASAGVFAAAVGNVGQALLSMGAQMFDKDTTLTGRTYLWYRAHDLIVEKPWLGRGFYAFWRQGNTDAEGLWQYAGITGRAGFNFHNALVELTVQLGMVGAAVFCLIGLLGLLALVRRFIERPSLPICFWLTYMLYVVIRAPMEAVGYAPFYFSTCLLFGAAGSGLQRLPRRAPRVRRFHPQALRLQPFYARHTRASAAEALAPAGRS